MVNELIRISREAGSKILDIYHNADFSEIVDFKADDSPLTLADKVAHQHIAAELQNYFPDIPVLSEEGKTIDYEVRKNWSRFWLVDPLDGTKEFIKRNGDFTVNIALVEEEKATLGVIFAPTHDTTYFGSLQKGAFKQVGDAQAQKIRVNDKVEDLIAVVSRSHATPEDQRIMETYKVTQSISVGSSLKFCMVAEGKADIYFRSGPTMEWDTGAGQAILESAGGQMETKEGKPFTYNKSSLLNPGFLCKGW